MSRDELDIALPCPAWAETLPEVEALCHRAVAATLRLAPRPPRDALEISLVLGDDELVQGLNRQYRGRDAPTNVLSFATGEDGAVEEGPLLLGDVIVAYQTTAAEAIRDGKTLADHLSHLVVHGVLHLLGYDHIEEAEADRMEELETAILGSLGIADPYRPDPGDAVEEHDQAT